LLTLVENDSQVFHVQCWDSDGVTPLTPISGYFWLTRVNDATVVVSGNPNLTISGQDVYYSLSGPSNTVCGFMKYNFTMYFSGDVIQTMGAYCEIVARND
jgi:hypothetical protein